MAKALYPLLAALTRHAEPTDVFLYPEFFPLTLHSSYLDNVVCALAQKPAPFDTAALTAAFIFLATTSVRSICILRA